MPSGGSSPVSYLILPPPSEASPLPPPQAFIGILSASSEPPPPSPLPLLQAIKQPFMGNISPFKSSPLQVLRESLPLVHHQSRSRNANIGPSYRWPWTRLTSAVALPKRLLGTRWASTTDATRLDVNILTLITLKLNDLQPFNYVINISVKQKLRTRFGPCFTSSGELIDALTYARANPLMRNVKIMGRGDSHMDS
uniref:Uncharacterized protein n=1 Tax=Oryza punctata TaxID=4537 RepID=A0A0E0JVL7_ORYPU